MSVTASQPTTTRKAFEGEYEGNQIATDHFSNETLATTFMTYYDKYSERLVRHAIRHAKVDRSMATQASDNILMKFGMGHKENWAYDPGKSHLSFLLTCTYREAVRISKGECSQFTTNVIVESRLSGAVGEEGNSNPLDYYSNMGGGSDDYIQIVDRLDEGVNSTGTKKILAIAKYFLEIHASPVVQDAIKSGLDSTVSYRDLVAKHADVNTEAAIKTAVCRFRNRLAEQMRRYDNWKQIMAGKIVNDYFTQFKHSSKTGKAYLYRAGKAVHGELHGMVKEYDEKGELISKISYNMGMIKKTVAIESNGAETTTVFCSKNNWVTSSKTIFAGTLTAEVIYEEGVIAYSAVLEDGVWEENIL